MADKKTPQHAPMDQFLQIDNQIAVDGKSISQIAAIAGQTPFYLYDRSVIKRNINRLRHFFPDISLHYAIKANPYQPLVSYVSELVDGLDVASAIELRTALASKTHTANISFAGPGKSQTEIQMAIAAGVTLNVESQVELERIIQSASEQKIVAKIALRLNPDFELKSSGMKMGGGSQQFGIDVEQLDDIFKLLQSPHLEFVGLHIFTGSQNLNPQSLISAHDNIFALVDKLRNQYNFKLQHLNIGGGFGIPYFPGDTSLDLEPISNNLKALLEQYADCIENCEVILELGRYIVGNAGLYICQITDKKISRGETYLVTNGGLHHHLAASGNFGQIIRKNYPVAIANKLYHQELFTVNVVGPLCTPLDILANKYLLPNAEIGDYIAVYQSGAYGITASPQGFLSHPAAIELFL